MFRPYVVLAATAHLKRHHAAYVILDITKINKAKSRALHVRLDLFRTPQGKPLVSYVAKDLLRPYPDRRPATCVILVHIKMK